MICRLLLLFAVVSLVGCCPYRHLATSSRDSLRIEIRSHTEYLRDTVFLEVPVERERQTVRDTMSHLETSFAVSDARINPDGALFHSLANKPQKYPVSIETKIEYRDSIVFRDRVTERHILIPRELTWWQKTQMRGFWILLAAISILIGWRFRRLF